MMTSMACPTHTAVLHSLDYEQRTQPRRILLATDLEDLSHTLPIVAAQARLYGAEILVAHVLPDFTSPQAAPSLLLMARPDHYVRYAEEVLSAAARQACAEGLSVSFRMLRGNVTEQIEQLGDEWQADRIVVGCHGAEKFYLHLLGSNAERIFRQTSLPVMGIGPHARLQPEFGRRRMRVLIPVSSRRKTQFLFQYAAMFAEMDQVDVTVLHVVEDSSSFQLESTNLQACEAWLRSQVDLYAGDHPTSCLVENGPVTDVILKTAERGEFDMVVLGNTSASSFSPSLAPSAAFQVLSSAPCPVLVVKDEEACVYGC